MEAAAEEEGGKWNLPCASFHFVATIYVRLPGGTATLGCLERIEDSGSIGPEANGTHQTLMNLDKQISERREVELCSHSTATSVCHRFAMNR